MQNAARVNATLLDRVRAYFERRPIAAFLIILLIGLIARLIMLPGDGFLIDQQQYYEWAACANNNGVFGLYRCAATPNYPPLIPALLGLSLSLYRVFGDVSIPLQNNPALLAMLKLPGLLFEVALISLFFYIAYKKAGVWWASFVIAALYWNPGFATVTAWWGQTDAIYSFFLLLTAYLLVQRRPRLLWFVFGLAILTKFQSIEFLPILGILSLRRFGWKTTAVGCTLFVLTFALGELPFFLGSGALARAPFSNSVNLFPYISNGAHNFWFWVSGSSPTVLLDNLKVVGGISYFQAGVVLLVVGTAIICLRAWVLNDRADVYLLFAAANFTFYMLPTQIQVRYLYPGVMFLALAMIRDRRLIVLYIVTALAFTHNVFAAVWLGIGLLFYPSKLLFWKPVHDALAMTAVYITLMAIFMRPLLSRSLFLRGNDGKR
ncbi:MAG: hypothetical protein ABI700_03260 [Chloroflexota bacterium]